MSLDLYIADENFNITYNVSKMWYSVFTDDEGMVNIEGRTGKEAYYKVKMGFDSILDNYSKMVKLEPENGWGNTEGFLKFLCKVLIACKEHPNKKWGASR